MEEWDAAFVSQHKETITESAKRQADWMIERGLFIHETECRG